MLATGFESMTQVKRDLTIVAAVHAPLISQDFNFLVVEHKRGVEYRCEFEDFLLQLIELAATN
jgi:hypothetical protein